MPIVLSVGLTPPEIRVLQEFRRLAADTLDLAAIKAVKHPAGGGDVPAKSLVTKGFLTVDGDRFTLTDQARELLAYDPKPEFEEAGPAAAEAE